MTKLTLEQQELLFANDCKLINLRYEYHGYTGTEKWAIVTELAEEELWVKYPDVIRRYTPFILLSMAQGEVIDESFEKLSDIKVLVSGVCGYDWYGTSCWRGYRVKMVRY